jgi:hypothetical protein
MNSGTSGPFSGEYTGKVYYDKKDKNRNSIFIIFYDGQPLIPFSVDNDGNIGSCPSGKFNNKNSVEFTYSSDCVPAHALGGKTNYTVTGIKK